MGRLSTASTVSLGCAAGVLLALGIISARFAARPDLTDAPVDTALFGQLRGFRPAGWEVSELPLGATEQDLKAVSRILQADQTVYLVFTKGSRQFGLYVSHWRPGKVDIRTVNAHTPDTCWLNTGWSTREFKGGFTGYPPGPVLAPGQQRCYEQETGEKQYVVFWHFLGGEPVAMWRNGFPLPAFMWRIFRGDRSALNGAQYFVRISSTETIGEIWREPAFQDILRILGPIGLLPEPSR